MTKNQGYSPAQTLFPGLVLAAETGGGGETPPVAQPIAEAPGPTPTPSPEAAAPVLPETKPPESKATVPAEIFDKRVNEITAQRYAEKQRGDQLQAELLRLQTQLASLQPAAGQPPATTPAATEQIQADVVTRQAQLMAAQIAATESFNNRCNEVAEKGKKEFGGPEFTQSITMLNQLGTMTPQFIEAALETGVGEKIIHALSKDPEKAMEVAKLSPVRQAVALAKIAATFEAPVRASNAPAPITAAVSGDGAAPSALRNPNSSIKDWMAARNAELAAKHKARGR